MSLQQVWHYENSQWRSIPNPLENTPEWEEALAKGGYHLLPTQAFGDAENTHVAVYSSTGSGGVEALQSAVIYPYIIVVCLPNEMFDIYVSDFPNLLELLTKLCSVIMAGSEAMGLSLTSLIAGGMIESGQGKEERAVAI